ncbi:MAG TPA: SRPBCC family protein [Acidimicrobiales bacterium]|nr:SRPBCC family protein [Acidimicrobiales bacterium]
MELSEELHTGADPDDLYDLLADLGNYPDWLGMVAHVDAEVGPHRDLRGSWLVELRGRVGPFARSKRLRMVRTTAERPRLVRYERDETDGREHAPWQFEAHIVPSERGATLTVHLHYGGSRFAPVLAPILREEIRKGRRLLQERYPLD